MMLDLIFAVLGICLLLVIVVPGVYSYVKSIRENVREKDVKNAFFNTLYFGVVLVLSTLLLKSIGVFKGFGTIAVYLHWCNVTNGTLSMGFNVIEFAPQCHRVWALIALTLEAKLNAVGRIPISSCQPND